MEKRTIVYIVISIFTLIVILATEPLYNATLFNWSITTIPKLQAGTSSFQNSMWEAYSTAGLVVASALPIGVSFVYTMT
jgi:hypothetical protein